MPTYDYQCGKCGVEFEREQRITDPPVKTCPKCKSRQVKRLLSAPGFILKGGGWYADGYGSSGKKSGGGGESSGDAVGHYETPRGVVVGERSIALPWEVRRGHQARYARRAEIPPPRESVKTIASDPRWK